jgi:hypothetical protein
MASARPLRDVFADLAGAPSSGDDPAAILSEHGHPGLPGDLVAEAVVSYAETAPIEVAEHLAPYVTAHSVVGADPETADEPADWPGLLGTAPAIPDEPIDLDALTPTLGVDLDGAADIDEAGLDFGTGAGVVSVLEPVTDGVSEEDEFTGTPAADLTADDFHAADFDTEDFDDDGETDPGDIPLG